ncbi:Stf0 family sulfotransferase [Actinoplanes friuliensis]|jgi:LPS sulfotransferase NodH|uniref:Trehalose 2-sulfotransferase n=1 Tax=Actinoplanes friuliensis DSM 7358 TaxID=1246995 RepID=U5W2V8_9ACTN|nr:Stf0 family sulfotransferase [Actinoplanes friuliensis]AGZ42325.1 hypothetical protein AFR_20265 [Actinoplanes friuliensis DSM 7358]
MIDSYFVCATPRTGSSLLIGLLGSTGVAGHPESYFRDPDQEMWAERWGIPGAGYPEFAQAAKRAGTTGNGVFGAKLMWGTTTELVQKLAPGRAGDDRGVLEETFGDLRFVHLRREDTLAQAVSWLRAEQTQIWYAGDNGDAAHTPVYDEDRITGLLSTIDEHNAAWRAWFAEYALTPYEITYERLTADLAGTTRDVLGFLGLELPPGGAITPRHRRQADRINDEWVTRYRRSTAL